MTRYARARGSASSNAREPEEATPWEQMRIKNSHGGTQTGHKHKEEDDANNGPVAKKKRTDNPELMEDEDEGYVVEDVKAAEGSDGKEDSGVGNDDSDEEDEDDGDEEADDKAGKKLKSKESEEEEEPKKKKKKKRSQNKCLNCKEKGHLKMDCPKLSEERRNELRDLLEKKKGRKGVRQRNRENMEKRQAATKCMLCEGSGHKKAECPQASQEVKDRMKKLTDKKRDKKQRWKKNKEEKEKRGGGPVKKDKAGQVIQEGESTFQGFRVGKEDGVRLRKLAKDLEDKGLRGDELKEALKKERRKAERDLAKYYKLVCYNCRKPGHVLADCPAAKEEVMDREVMHSGQCYKCGSDDHTSKECKASKRKAGDAFAYAVCFICKQTGHIAKACPDNPRGLYPKGGGCRFCGSVEHLKSDCPRKGEKDAREEVRVGKVDSGALEVESASTPAKKRKKGEEAKKKKVVNF